jgi:hypothetical protein
MPDWPPHPHSEDLRKIPVWLRQREGKNNLYEISPENSPYNKYRKQQQGDHWA